MLLVVISIGSLAAVHALTIDSLSFATGTYTAHPCIASSTTCDSARATGTTISSSYGKSRNPSFTITATWTGGTAAENYCFCRLRANMYGFDDPFDNNHNPETSTTDGITTAGGALTDSKLEPWGQHWYRCWDQNSDEPPSTTSTQNSITVTGPSDSPFVNLPDGYYHFAVSCTDGGTPGTFATSQTYFKIDNVAPETTITPYIAKQQSSIPGHSGALPSYDPAASDHRLRYSKTSSKDPTNKVPTRLFDFKLSVVDYHGSANADVSPYNPYDAPITSSNIHGLFDTGDTFWAEYDVISYQCKIDDGSWYACDSSSFGTPFESTSGDTTQRYGHYYYDDGATTGYAGVHDGERFITTKQLSTGTHVLMVKATDLAGNTEMPTMYSFYVAPFTKGGFNSGCTYGYKLTNSNSSATYSMTDFDLVDTTSVTVSDLTDGTHTLEIYAKDEFGHETAAASHQSVSWTVDRTGPDAVFEDSWSLRNTAKDSSYVANTGSASLTNAYYKWSFSGISTLSTPIYSRYSIDGQTYTMDGFSSTTASGDFSNLNVPPFSHTFPKTTFAVGGHTVKVLGIDYVGNQGTPAEDTFTVEELDTILNCDKCAICDWDPTTGCTNCQDLSSVYVTDSVTFDISAMTDGTPIKFKYDYIFSDDATSTTYTKGEHIPEFTVRNIGEGKYYVLAKGRTLGGTYDATPSCVMMSTDTTKPVVSINTDLGRINNPDRMPTKVAGTVLDLNWKYDGTTWMIKQVGSNTILASGTSQQATSTATAKMLVSASSEDENVGVWELDISDVVNSAVMGEGQYVLTIHSTDKAGHTASALEHDWIIDMGPPDTHVVNGPSSMTGSTTAKIMFACEESSAISFCSYQYRMSPTEAFQPANCNLDKYCQIEVTSSPGVNTIEVKAVDLAGNEDESSQYYTWIVYSAEQFAAFQNLSSFTSPWGMGPVTFSTS